MIIEINLKFKDGYCSLHCDDLPGLNLFGDHPEKVLADFIPAWRKLHEISPKQVMPVPVPNGEWPTKKRKRK